MPRHRSDIPPTSSSTRFCRTRAYDMLLRGRRQELHARVATVLEQKFADLVERQPEILAHHLTAAGETERAVNQWLKAGRHAAARLAHVEATSHFERGLASVGGIAGRSSSGRTGDRAAIGPRLIAVHRRKASCRLTPATFTRARASWPSSGATRTSCSWRSTAFGNRPQAAGKILDCRRLSNRLQQLTADDHE